MVSQPWKGAPTLFLIDGNSFCYRAYYAIPQLSNSRGEPTNAIYGFVNMLRKLINEGKPDYLAICFDRKEPTFRHEKYKEYKAQRKPMPDDLVEQIPPIKEFCRAYRYALFEEPGYEADDLIGTLARKAEKEGMNVFLITGDKDAFQLVNERIKVMNPHKENRIYDSEAVRKRFGGLGPDRVTDVMALMGDASDNIPGVPGIGEKTAIKLISEFGSVENLMKHLNRVKSKSQQSLLKEHRETAILSKALATIDTEVPLEFSWDALRLQPPEEAKLVELLKRYEFRALLKEYMPTGEAKRECRRYELIDTEEALAVLVKKLNKAERFSFDTETTATDPMLAELVGLSFCWEPFCAAYVPVSSSRHQGPGLPVEKVLKTLRPLLEDEKKFKLGQNVKYDWILMKRHGITLSGMSFDTMIASYLVNPLRRNHNLDDISLEYLGVKKIATSSLIGSGAKQISMDQVPLKKVAEYAAEDADCVFRLAPLLETRLRHDGLRELFEKVEMPLVSVLAKMEMNGVKIDIKFLKELSEKADVDLTALTQQIYREAGEEFNIDSPKQLAEILFVKLRLPPIKRTKTGYSTDVSVLEKLAQSYELPRKILEYREKAKLKSTYLDALPKMVHPVTGLIHTSYHQTTTATGRLSSTEPNLQNIPVRTETGRLIRKAFVPREANRLILSADYSQIELRILAHFSGDKKLTTAFAEDRDIHNVTATLLYGVPENAVTREMRRFAKVINFSVIYGKTAYGLSQELGISVGEAETFIENYFKRYAGVRDYLESQKETARKKGFLTTLLGRRAYFPDIHSKNTALRQFAERAAINAPIQGSAADLIKLAMIAIQGRIEKEGVHGLMIMQVHDELVFDIAKTEKESMSLLVREEMEKAYALDVPLRADVFVGDSWFKG